MRKTTKRKPTYNADSIEVLEDLEHLRKRPGMYIASVDSLGIKQLLVEAVGNSLDEYLEGHCDRIWVSIDTETQTITVCDNGRGIPLEDHKQTGISTLTTVLTNLQAGGKFGKQAYAVSSGLHGIGLKAINALSSNLRATVWRRGKAYSQEFAKGQYTEMPKLNRDLHQHQHRGTEIRFTPDPEIFGDSKIPVDEVKEYLTSVTYLCPGLNLTYERDGRNNIMPSNRSLKALVEKDLERRDILALHEPIVVKDDVGLIDASLCWTDDPEAEVWRSYCNLSSTPDHGTHLTGLKRAIGKAVTETSTSAQVNPADVRSGMVGVIHVKVSEPVFRSQVKSKLMSPGVEQQVFDVVYPALQKFFKKNKHVAKQIIERATRLKKAREQYKKLKKAASGVKVVSRSAKGLLPGKLVEAPNCHWEDRELFICEGNSAAGSAVAARDANYQEILPLRGKVLNAARATPTQVLKNEEMKSILTATGVGVDPTTGTYSLMDSLRVGKVLILTDADQDGHHIAALVVTFISTYMYSLIEQGRVYLVRSPLFRGRNASGDKYWFGDSIEDLEKASKLHRSKIQISRLKGLGEADANELRLSMDPKTRRLIQVTTDPDQQELVAQYMGTDASTRKLMLNIC